jgi:UDP-N-acetyl-D-glucosamine/UDP-N-acetyl-D-galactosamine dehydrogenase
MKLDDKIICVIGLGYVGLPLAVEFGKRRRVIGFDIREERVQELRVGRDKTLEVGPDELNSASFLEFTSSVEDLRLCGVFIVAVPTPVDKAHRPDLSLLQRATETVGRAMRPGAVVVYESTVYPGCTRNVCAPILERASGLELNRDFFVGYSPERINPGDKQHRLPTIVKITSGSTAEAADAIDALYGSIITAGTYKAASIEVAEAAKVIENTQRDLNIALMNDLAIIFQKLGIDTNDVLTAAATKWNFLSFRPGLVGGHCIGVDPYYLTHRAQEIGYHPEVILAGRRINDSMGIYIADRLARLMMKRGFPVAGSRILVMGFTFKENCPDLRNTRVIDIIHELGEFNAIVDVHDPWADPKDAEREYGLTLLSAFPAPDVYDAIVLAVGHDKYAHMGVEAIRSLGKPGAVLFDVKGIFPKGLSEERL